MKTNTTAMNEHQAKAWRIIKKEAGDIVGGLENQMMDYCEEEDEYKEAEEALADRDALIDCIYGAVMWSRNSDKNLRFAGREWIENKIEELLKEWGS